MPILCRRFKDFTRLQNIYCDSVGTETLSAKEKPKALITITFNCDLQTDVTNFGPKVLYTFFSLKIVKIKAYTFVFLSEILLSEKVQGHFNFPGEGS